MLQKIITGGCHGVKDLLFRFWIIRCINAAYIFLVVVSNNWLFSSVIVQFVVHKIRGSKLADGTSMYIW